MKKKLLFNDFFLYLNFEKKKKGVSDFESVDLEILIKQEQKELLIILRY